MRKYSLVLENFKFKGNCGFFFSSILFIQSSFFVFLSTSFVTCLLAASIQEEGICLDKDCGDLVDTDIYSFFFLFLF